MGNIHEANKHLTYEERTFIENGLNQGRNYTEIAKDINKDRRTIAREIEKHKFKKKPGKFNGKTDFCERRYECNKFDCNEKDKCYKEEVCEYLLKPPYVCNGCENRVKTALSEIAGIESVDANHNTGMVTVKSENDLDVAQIKERITDLGFEIIEEQEYEKYNTCD